tara:strand:+ start:340 stop:465 length:126 start_codon:yes stop_codon:yes gene_type:complete
MGSPLDRDDLELMMDDMKPKGIIIGGILGTLISIIIFYNLL